MTRYVGRHALSEANNHNNYGTPAFGNPNARLMPEGREMARGMGTRFYKDYGINPATTSVAVSNMFRSPETALEAGFTDLHAYAIFNEIDTQLPYLELRKTIAGRKHTKIALQTAELILNNPPEEKVWIIHGLVIAGITEVLGVADQYEHFVPKLCEIRELPI